MSSIIVIGAGSRSNTYCTYFLENPSAGKVVAVAEPNKQRRDNFSERFSISSENQYESWEAVLKLDHKIGDTVLIGTLCNLHCETAIRASNLGYDIILEKPMSYNIEECLKIYDVAIKNDTNLMLCHVMRYHPIYQEARKIIADGILGKVTTVQWLQPINRLHFAKSYVRHPIWSRKELAGPLTLSKGCHDFDLVYWILGGEDAEVVSSIGQKTQFLPQMQPKEANDATKCTKCPINDTCTFSALENYGTHQRYRKYVTNQPNPTRENAIKDLEDGPYDDCVYNNGSNVMEDYVVSMRVYNDDFTSLVSMVFSALHDDICWRTATFVGTGATLELSEKNQTITIIHHTTSDGVQGKIELVDCNRIKLDGINTKMTSHSGGDFYFMDSIMRGDHLTPVYESMASHILAFDAEEARIQGSFWRPKRVSRVKNSIKILATTENKEKIQAIQNIFEYKLNCVPTIVGISTDSGVPDGQPYDLGGTFQGAQQRIANLGEKVFGYDYVVSIENGIVTLNTNDTSINLDVPIVIILDTKINKYITHFGGSRDIPLKEMRSMKKLGSSQKERGLFVKNHYNKLNYSQTRGRLIENALLMCLEELANS